MKRFLIYASILVLFSACHKQQGCEMAMVRHYYNCNFYGLQVGTNLYQAPSLPAAFQQDSLHVCVTYTLKEDMKMCPGICCGGYIAEITSIKRVD